MSTYSRYRRRIGDTVNNGVAWKTPSCICSCQWRIKSEVFWVNFWTLRRWLEAATGCRQGPQYDGKCSFYLHCYFFRTSQTNRDLREKAVYFPPRMHMTHHLVQFPFGRNTYFRLINTRLEIWQCEAGRGELQQAAANSQKLMSDCQYDRKSIFFNCWFSAELLSHGDLRLKA